MSLVAGAQRYDTARRSDVALVGVIDRERSAEAATGIAGRQLAQGQTAHPTQQLHGLVADPQSQHRMACGVISDRLQSLIDRVCELRWHTLGTTGVVSSSPLGALQITELQ
jgi:hypothetical protein